MYKHMKQTVKKSFNDFSTFTHNDSRVLIKDLCLSVH